MKTLVSALRALWPGLMLVLVVALAAGFVSDHYGGPTLLYALLLGMAFNHLAASENYRPGIDFAARHILRFGVALLGVRITLEQILALGPRPILVVLIAVPATVLAGLLLARLLGRRRDFGALSAGAVAICGASAAMALAAVLPRHQHADRHLIFTVIGVTALSTVAMILYPLITTALNLDPVSAGIFIGASIHDVAQVVGAGYLLGDTAGDTATFTKLLRVAMLVPVVIVYSVVFRQRSEGDRRPPILPLFLVGFLLLVGINSLGWIPPSLGSGLAELSRWCLVTAIAAIGVKAHLGELSGLGWRPLLLITGETVFLALLCLGLLHVIPS